MSCNLHSGFPPLHRKANKVLQGGMSKVAFYRIIPCLRVTNSKTTHQGPLLLGSAVSGWLCQLGFLCSSGEKPFPVGLVNQLFQPASNQIKTVDKAFTWLFGLTVVHLRTIPSSYCISAKNGWKSVLLKEVKRLNPDWSWLKRLISIEHNLTDTDSNKYNCFEYLLLIRLTIKYLLSYFFGSIP